MNAEIEAISVDEENGQVAPYVFVLFGATGDLAKRKLYPALYNLWLGGLMPSAFKVIGTARRQMNDETFRAHVRESIESFSRRELDESRWKSFVDQFHYVVVNAGNPEDYRDLHDKVNELEQQDNLPGNRMFYLAMAPDFFGTVALNIKGGGLADTPGWKRLIIEKPFGTDFDSAQKLNGQLRQVFEEEEIYRIDHYLGKEMVQNIEVIRFANSMFEPVWNNRSIANIQITSSETVGVEERAGYYDHSGALRDMIQNHMLQMVMMVAMEPPSRLKTEAIRDEKVKVLRSLRRYTEDEVQHQVVRGQYIAGSLGNEALPAYRDEHGVAKGSMTETFIAARLFVDNFRWSGVPFYVRTGKRLARKSTEIVIQFREMPKHLYFNRNGELGPNLLVIRVNPVEGMYVQLNVKRPGTEGGVLPVAMEFCHSENDMPEAYERLLYDASRGDSTFFTRWDEVSLAWKFVDPLANAFRDNSLPLHEYKAGSFGPEASHQLLRDDGFRWWPVYGEETMSVEEVLEHTVGQPIVQR